MIVKILKASATFAAVKYNTNKIDRDKGELMKAANFGPLQSLGNLRPQDYINYLKMVSAQNKRISKPQFHAVISAKGNSVGKEQLSVIAEQWLNEMGYGKQPYLIIYHKDTDNNHVHLVSTRVDRDGNKISSEFEFKRAIKNLHKVSGLDYALAYNFSTKAQFRLLLELNGFPAAELNVNQRLDKYSLNRIRAGEIAALFSELKANPDFTTWLKEKYYIELIFHTSGDQKPYGYTIIDHAEKNVFKGSEVMPLKELLHITSLSAFSGYSSVITEESEPFLPLIQISITDDVDDEAVHRKNRSGKNKAKKQHR